MPDSKRFQAGDRNGGDIRSARRDCRNHVLPQTPAKGRQAEVATMVATRGSSVTRAASMSHRSAQLGGKQDSARQRGTRSLDLPRAARGQWGRPGTHLRLLLSGAGGPKGRRFNPAAPPALTSQRPSLRASITSAGRGLRPFAAGQAWRLVRTSEPDLSRSSTGRKAWTSRAPRPSTSSPHVGMRPRGPPASGRAAPNGRDPA
jgi:hypothetical protein